MAPKNGEPAKREMSRGAWTADEDRKLEQHIELHGAKRWKTIASKSGLNRCGKSCRLRWLNYLRPNIKRGNISSDEEDMIVRLHKLLGNRWSLIAGRLPGRTDNEIKNYWNTHLSKKTIQNIDNNEDIAKIATTPAALPSCTKEINDDHETRIPSEKKVHAVGAEGCNLQGDLGFNTNEFFDFSVEGCYGLEWVNKFLEQDDGQKLVEEEKVSSELDDGQKLVEEEKVSSELQE